MNISEFKKLIKECILEVKVKRSVKNLIKESLKDVKVEKGESLHHKMEEDIDYQFLVDLYTSAK